MKETNLAVDISPKNVINMRDYVLGQVEKKGTSNVKGIRILENELAEAEVNKSNFYWKARDYGLVSRILKISSEVTLAITGATCAISYTIGHFGNSLESLNYAEGVAWTSLFFLGSATIETILSDYFTKKQNKFSKKRFEIEKSLNNIYEQRSGESLE